MVIVGTLGVSFSGISLATYNPSTVFPSTVRSYNGIRGSRGMTVPPEYRTLVLDVMPAHLSGHLERIAVSKVRVCGRDGKDDGVRVVDVHHAHSADLLLYVCRLIPCGDLADAHKARQLSEQSCGEMPTWTPFETDRA